MATPDALAKEPNFIDRYFARLRNPETRTSTIAKTAGVALVIFGGAYLVGRHGDRRYGTGYRDGWRARADENDAEEEESDE